MVFFLSGVSPLGFISAESSESGFAASTATGDSRHAGNLVDKTKKPHRDCSPAAVGPIPVARSYRLCPFTVTIFTSALFFAQGLLFELSLGLQMHSNHSAVIGNVNRDLGARLGLPRRAQCRMNLGQVFLLELYIYR
jgi:hypothetical protein